MAVVVVIGGGCYGRYHARQLLKAIRRGRLPEHRLLVVDRDPRCAAARELVGLPEVSLVTEDWAAFLHRWLGSAERYSNADHLVPAPFAPHLLWEWLAGELAAQAEEPPSGWSLPFERRGGSGQLLLSAAAWTCPSTCVEPAHCPMLHAPRDWDLADLIQERAAELGYRPAVFRCLPLANGVGSVRVAEVLAIRDRLRDGAGPVLVATSSRCHAAIGALRVEPASAVPR
ncbi:MAG TPA: hypothetical protein VKY90_00700 [Candidatus Dormibacteraeota bacterium]|nr:hypothetical protein [Candidatus Dormibacteraeota bacterium]